MNIHSPKILIDDTLYLVDGEASVFQQWDDPNNKINLKGLTKDGAGRRMVYDNRLQNRAEGFNRVPFVRPSLKEIFIPDQLLKWHDHPRQDAINKFNQDARQQDWNITLISADLNQRLLGRLPTVDIGGDVFTFDWRLQEIRHADEIYPAISLEEMEYLDESGLQFFYDKNNKAIYPLPADIRKIPEGVVLVQLEDAFVMDSVALARGDRLWELSYETQFPYKAHHVATVIPLTQTNLLALIAANSEEEPLQKEVDQPLRFQLLEMDGTPVLVDPDLMEDTYHNQGRLGIIRGMDPTRTNYYVEFDELINGYYHPEELLVLKRPGELQKELDPGKNDGSLHSYLRLIDVYKYSLSGEYADIKKAMNMVRDYPHVRFLSTISLQEEIYRQLEANKEKENKPGRGR